MAGNGVTVQMRDSRGRILPGSGSGPGRVRSAAVARWGASRTPMDRLATAFDFARAALAAAGRGGLDTDGEIDRLTRVLWAAGEVLTRQAEGERDG